MTSEPKKSAQPQHHPEAGPEPRFGGEGPDQTPGKVILVGAGPGDPSLITVAGLEALRTADAVVYDALANPALLDHVPDNAPRVDAGKRAKEHRLTQDQTNALLVELAQRHPRVVRLKGGDPYLFGRGAEEAAYLARHGVACEVIPGITAGIAAPMFAGIPVTHREHASTVTFVTAHEDPTKDHSAVDYPALAKLIAAGGTACFYMGVGRLPGLASTLTEHGLNDTTPAAVVRWGTLPKQQSVRGTLADIAQRVAAAGIGAPAIIVVGPVAGLDEPGLDFFQSRPLFGRTVLVTRTRQQASVLSARLTELGARVIEAPTVQLVEPDDWSPVDEALRGIGQHDWLLLTSRNAVRVLAERLAVIGKDARHLASVRIGVVGKATASALRDTLAIDADLAPDKASAESLAQALVDAGEAAGRSHLALRADIATPVLGETLTGAGARFTDCVAYHTRAAASLPDEALDALRAGAVDWVALSSSSTIRNLVGLLGNERGMLDSCRLASIGPVTSATIRELGLGVSVESVTADVRGLADAIVEASSSDTR